MFFYPLDVTWKTEINKMKASTFMHAQEGGIIYTTVGACVTDLPP